MKKQLTIEDARQSLTAHVAAKGEEIRAKYGPHIGWSQLRQLLDDRTFVRYPCTIVFDAGPLRDGEFAHPVARGECPNDGFTIYLHPYYASQPERLAYLVLYQLVVVNYGEFASADDAEIFGASILGLSKDEYYRIVCGMADEIASPELA